MITIMITIIIIIVVVVVVGFPFLSKIGIWAAIRDCQFLTPPYSLNAPAYWKRGSRTQHNSNREKTCIHKQREEVPPSTHLAGAAQLHLRAPGSTGMACARADTGKTGQFFWRAAASRAVRRGEPPGFILVTLLLLLLLILGLFYGARRAPSPVERRPGPHPELHGGLGVDLEELVHGHFLHPPFSLHYLPIPLPLPLIIIIIIIIIKLLYSDLLLPYSYLLFSHPPWAAGWSIIGRRRWRRRQRWCCFAGRGSLGDNDERVGE